MGVWGLRPQRVQGSALAFLSSADSITRLQRRVTVSRRFAP